MLMIRVLGVIAVKDIKTIATREQEAQCRVKSRADAEEDTMSHSFVAKLVGSDGQIISRSFEEMSGAVTWVLAMGSPISESPKRGVKSVLRGEG